MYMEFSKMVMITLYAKQKKRHRCTEQSFGLWEKARVGRENSMNIIYSATDHQPRWDA